VIVVNKEMQVPSVTNRVPDRAGGLSIVLISSRLLPSEFRTNRPDGR